MLPAELAKKSLSPRFSRRAGLLALAASGLLAAPAALAQEGGDGGGSSEYVGVAPGQSRKNPLPPPKSSELQLVWTGFQKAEQGGSRVFLQTTGPVTYDISDGKDGKQLSVYLRNCRIHLENNQRKLDTRFFDTPVAGVKARQRKKDVEVTITLKQSAAPTPRTESGPEGSQYLVLEFAPPDRDQPAATE